MTKYWPNILSLPLLEEIRALKFKLGFTDQTFGTFIFAEALDALGFRCVT